MRENWEEDKIWHFLLQRPVNGTGEGCIMRVPKEGITYDDKSGNVRKA